VAYVRAGVVGSLRALELKAVSVGSNTDGGYLLSPEIETMIGQRFTAISPIRSRFSHFSSNPRRYLEIQ